MVEQLKKIRDEEKAHLDFLRKAQDDENAKYEDPSDKDDEEYDEAFVDKMKAIFGLKEDEEND